MVVAAVVISVVALGVSIWALVSTRSPGELSTASPGRPESSQPGDDRARVCGAFDLVRAAVTLQTNTNLGDDPVAVHAVAANSRLATLGGGQFLLSALDGGVSSELADAVRSFATNLEYIAISQLAGDRRDDPLQTTRMNDAQAIATRIEELCK